MSWFSDILAVMPEQRVISIAEVAYVSCIRVLAQRVGANRPEVATAFVVSNADERMYLVTARHVVANADTMTLFFYPGVEGLSLEAPLQYRVAEPTGFWRVHPDANVDVAVADIDPVIDAFNADGTPIFVSAIGCGDIEPRREPREPVFTDPFWHPLPLDEVLIVGYPQDYRDIATGLPLLRRGRVATPLWLDFGGSPMFLVDAAVQHGTSGGQYFTHRRCSALAAQCTAILDNSLSSAYSVRCFRLRSALTPKSVSRAARRTSVPLIRLTPCWI